MWGWHHWGREIAKLGHEVRLIPPKYVKPFVKRQKNDAADAEAICEAAQRQSMRFVAVKSAGAQASALVFRAQDLLVRQRTQIINAVRGHLTEYGYVAAKGPAHVAKLIAYIEDPESDLPEIARPILRVLIAWLKGLDEQIAGLDVEIGRRAKEEPTAKRLTTIPGIGPVIAPAIAALAPPPESFKRGRDFAAWVGLTPLQHSTGGKQKLGATSKMGERTLRRLLIIGASSVVRHAAHRGTPRRARGIVARAHAGAQATHARDRSTRQQNGQNSLGGLDDGHGLPSSARNASLDGRAQRPPA